MSAATIRNERCAVVLVERGESDLLVRLVREVTEALGVEAIGFGDKGSAVVALTELADENGKVDGCVLIANARGLLVLLEEVGVRQSLELQNHRPDDEASLDLRMVRRYLEDAIAGLAC